MKTKRTITEEQFLKLIGNLFLCNEKKYDDILSKIRLTDNAGYNMTDWGDFVIDSKLIPFDWFLNESGPDNL